VADARLRLVTGDAQAAFANANAVVAQIDKTNVPESQAGGVRARNNMLRTSLSTGAVAALRIGKFADAETLARRLATVPRDPTNDDDPQEQASRVGSLLAHALAMQGRRDDAAVALASGLAWYEREHKAGAHSTTFRRDYAYALYASALARSDDAAGRAKRDVDPAEATKLLDGASAEARQLRDYREIAGWIAGARGA